MGARQQQCHQTDERAPKRVAAVGEGHIGMAPILPAAFGHQRDQIRKRTTQSHASDVSSENRPNSAMEVTSTPLRPTLSAIQPPNSAPKNKPNVLALKKSP